MYFRPVLCNLISFDEVRGPDFGEVDVGVSNEVCVVGADLGEEGGEGGEAEHAEVEAVARVQDGESFVVDGFFGEEDRGGWFGEELPVVDGH